MTISFDLMLLNATELAALRLLVVRTANFESVFKIIDEAGRTNADDDYDRERAALREIFRNGAAG